jgi:septum formation protein
MKIILGSKSVGRKQILSDAGYEFDIMSADIDEKEIRSDNFEELPLLIAREKTKTLLKKIKTPAILITVDQVVVWNGELREKPVTENQAREYLESYNIQPAQINTAVVVTNTKSGKQKEIVDITKAYFKNIPSIVIDELINEGKVMNAAGGFIIEHPLLKPYIQQIEGDIDSITGLPLKLTEKLIEEIK